jgi:hypothetical protein
MLRRALISQYAECNHVDCHYADWIIIMQVVVLLNVGTGNTKGGSIAVPLASCLTGLESAV